MTFLDEAGVFFREMFQMIIEQRGDDVAARLDDVFLYRCFHGPVIPSPESFVRMMVTSGQIKLVSASIQSTMAREVDGIGLIDIGAKMEFVVGGNSIDGRFNSLMSMRKANGLWRWTGGQTSTDFKRPRSWGKDPYSPA